LTTVASSRIISHGAKMAQRPKINIQPLTADRWDDLVALFGPRGAMSDCWCMFWRLPRKQMRIMTPEERKESLHHMAMNDQVAGLLAYKDGEPVGWCSIGPREDYRALESSRLFKRLDDRPVWSIVCFFMYRSARGQGVMEAMIRGAVGYAKQHGAKIVEAYPTDLIAAGMQGKKLSGDQGYMGIASAFEKAGFVEASRPSETRVIMRKIIHR
jgi:GNAT superfamily N-acetyltransferase